MVRIKSLSLLLAIAVLLSATSLSTVGAYAAGDTFTAKNGDGVEIEYQISESGNVAVIANKNSEYSGNVTIPAKVTNNGTTYNVTAIGDKAFLNCSGLTDVKLPNSVTSIGEEAFEGCGLTNITLPSKVNSIGSFAFYQCSSLTSITLPDSVTSIGDDAFEFCSSLTNITLPSKVNSIGNFAFSHCSSLTGVTLPSGLTSISKGILASCSSLKSVTLPSSVTSIGNAAFMGCGSLTGITLPAGVKSIGGAAFLLCTGLTSVTLPSGVTSISNEAFCQCSSLKSITLPTSVTSIGGEAFKDCGGLENVYFDGDKPTIGDSAFSDCSGTLNFHCAGDGDFSKLSSYGAVHNKEKTYSIKVNSLSHGSIAPSTQKGMPGETISLTVKPDVGYALAADSLSYTDSGNRHSVAGNSFTMPAANVTVTAAFKRTSGGGSGSHHHSSHKSSEVPVSAPSLPSAVKDSSSGMEADLSGATFSSSVTGVTFSVIPETANGDSKGESGGTADPDGKAAYNLAVSDADLDVIGTPSLYKLKLLDQNGNAISFFIGSVTIKIPLPFGLRGTPRVFRCESDGTLTDRNATVENGSLVFQTDRFGDYIVADTGNSITLDTTSYQMSVGGRYQIGIRLTGHKAATVKAYSTNDKIATASKLKNGNIQITGKGTGTAYIMVDVYDSKNNLLSHASVRVEMIGGSSPHGDSTRQIAVY